MVASWQVSRARQRGPIGRSHFLGLARLLKGTQSVYGKRWVSIATLALVLGTILLAGHISSVYARGTPSDWTLAPERSFRPAENRAAAATPEAVVTGSTGLDIAANGSHLFVAMRGNSLETCGIQNPPPSNPVLIRLNLDGSAAQTLMERCHFAVDRILADDDYVYFIDDDGDLSRVPVNGGPLENMVGTDGGRGLALDGNYLYWTQLSGTSVNNLIFRIPKGGGLMDPIASVTNDEGAYQITDLVVDDDHLYWVQGGIGAGAVGRMDKNGGGITYLANEGDGVEDPISLAINDTYLFWTQWSDNQIRRVAKNGSGSVLSLNPSQNQYVSQFVAAGSNQLFWSETDLTANGRIRRIDQDGGNDTILSVGITGPQRLLLSETHVYWAQSGGVYRLPLGAPSQSVDLTISDLEVVQVLQSRMDDVPLIEGKTTVVRAYPELDITYSVITDAVLRGYRDGVLLGEIASMNPTVRVRSNGWNRENLEETFNFVLPPAWTAGSLTLEAEINAGLLVPEDNMANNSYQESFGFVAKNPICLMLHTVDLAGPDAPLSGTGIGPSLALARTLLPIPDFIPDTRPMISEAGGPYELPDDKVKILLKLSARLVLDALYDNQELYDCIDSNSSFHYVGVVDEFSDTGLLGSAYSAPLEPPVFFFKKQRGPAPLTPIQQEVIFGIDAVPFTYPWSGSILAHELSHNYNREHIDCGGPADPDTDYPYPPCQMDDSVAANATNSHWGLDYRQINNHKEEWALIDPGTSVDYMTYYDPAWVSDYTYQALFNRVPPIAAASSVEREQSSELLYVSGIITPTEASGNFDNIYRISQKELGTHGTTMLLDWGKALVDPAGPWLLEQIAADDTLLVSVAFRANQSGDYAPPKDTTPAASFVLPVRLEPGATGLRLRHNGAIVDQRRITPNAPRVTVLVPNGGEELGGSILVKWQAEDPDGDSLRFNLFYSGDNGQSWDMAASDLPGNSYTISDTDALPGSAGMSLIRVQASDGVNIGRDDSDRPFSLRPHKPHPFIETPNHGDIYGLGDHILLTGTAWDAEDGNLAYQSLFWSVDGQPWGTGRHLNLYGLATGAHEIQLMAVDSDNYAETMAILIHVQNRSCSDGDSKLDLVFVIDSSPSMNGHATEVCAAIPGIVSDLEEMGLQVRLDIFDVSEQRQAVSCATGTLALLDPNSEVNHPADWGAGVSSIAHGYDWRGDAARLIVPVSNQGPEDGDPVQDPGPDRVAVERAIVAANSVGAAVSPLIIPGQDRLASGLNRALSQDLAAQTGGTLLPWNDRESGIATALQISQSRISCHPEPEQMVSTAPTVPGERISLSGRNLWPGSSVFVGDQHATQVNSSPNGEMLTFVVPRDVDTDLPQDLRIGRGGAGERILAGAVSVREPPEVELHLHLPLVRR